MVLVEEQSGWSKKKFGLDARDRISTLVPPQDTFEFGLLVRRLAQEGKLDPEIGERLGVPSKVIFNLRLRFNIPSGERFAKQATVAAQVKQASELIDAGRMTAEEICRTTGLSEQQLYKIRRSLGKNKRLPRKSSYRGALGEKLEIAVQKYVDGIPTQKIDGYKSAYFREALKEALEERGIQQRGRGRPKGSKNISPASEETKRNLSDAVKQTHERERAQGIKRQLSEEGRRKISEATKRRWERERAEREGVK